MEIKPEGFLGAQASIAHSGVPGARTDNYLESFTFGCSACRAMGKCGVNCGLLSVVAGSHKHHERREGPTLAGDGYFDCHSTGTCAKQPGASPLYPTLMVIRCSLMGWIFFPSLSA